MSTLVMKQKVMAWAEDFTVYTDDQQPRYRIRGSLMRLPKRYDITRTDGTPVAEIVKSTLSLRPRFTLQLPGLPPVTIRKEFSWFKPVYSIDAGQLEVRGDWWDMQFTVWRDGQPVASVNRKLLSWADTYAMDITDESLEPVVALVVAIDRVRADASSVAIASS